MFPLISVEADMPQPPDALLPLKPADLHILLALVGEELHGYAIMQRVRDESDGQVELELGSLYRLIARLTDAGLIAHARLRKSGDDPRRRYYRITPLGRDVAAREARRLAGVVRLARSLRLLEGAQ